MKDSQFSLLLALVWIAPLAPSKWNLIGFIVGMIGWALLSLLECKLATPSHEGEKNG